MSATFWAARTPPGLSLASLADDYKKAKHLGEQAQINAQLASTKTRAGKAEKAAEALKESNRTLQEEMNRKSE